MLLVYNENSTLVPSEHTLSWEDVVSEFGTNDWRKELLTGLRRALINFAKAGCSSVLLNGSFVTNKEKPGDYDVAWVEDGVDDNLLDLVFFDYENGCERMKEEYLGEFFPSRMRTADGRFHRDFFKRIEMEQQRGLLKLTLEVYYD